MQAMQLDYLDFDYSEDAEGNGTFDAGRAMDRHARAGPQLHAQGEGGFHPVQINHVRTTERREVAALTNVCHQLPQHRMPHPVLCARAQAALGQPQQAWRGRITFPAGLARQQPASFKLAQHAVNAGLGPAGGFDGIGQAEGAPASADDLEQFKQAQARYRHKFRNSRRTKKSFRDYSVPWLSCIRIYSGAS